MQNHPQFKDFQKSLAIVFFALLGSQIVFALVALGLISSGLEIANPEFRTYGLIIVPFLVLAGFIASRFVPAKLHERARTSNDIEEKFNHYRSALIIRLGLLETPSFFAIIAYLFTGERLFLGFVGMILFYFITLFPSENRIISDLSQEE